MGDFHDRVAAPYEPGLAYDEEGAARSASADCRKRLRTRSIAKRRTRSVFSPTSFQRDLAYPQEISLGKTGEIDSGRYQIVPDDDGIRANGVDHLQRDRRDFTPGYVLSLVERFPVVVSGKPFSDTYLYFLALDVPMRHRSLNKMCD